MNTQKRQELTKRLIELGKQAESLEAQFIELAKLEVAYENGRLTWFHAVDAVQELLDISEEEAEDIVCEWDDNGWGD